VTTITVNPGQEEICWAITVEDITLPATAAHIHVAPREPGPHSSGPLGA
jgi:hypothetical protein